MVGNANARKAAPAEVGALRGPKNAASETANGRRYEENEPLQGGGEDECEKKTSNVDTVPCRRMTLSETKNRDMYSAGRVPVTPARRAYFGPTDATNGLDASNAVSA